MRQEAAGRFPCFQEITSYTWMKTERSCATTRTRPSIIPSRNPGTTPSKPGGAGENCRWSVREHTPKTHRAGTAIRTATATPHGATAAAEMRTTCDDTNPARHSPLSTHHTAHHERYHYGTRCD